MNLLPPIYGPYNPLFLSEPIPFYGPIFLERQTTVETGVLDGSSADTSALLVAVLYI